MSYPRWLQSARPHLLRVAVVVYQYSTQHFPMENKKESREAQEQEEMRDHGKRSRSAQKGKEVAAETALLDNPVFQRPREWNASGISVECEEDRR